jgi:hypothetical protein
MITDSYGQTQFTKLERETYKQDMLLFVQSQKFNYFITLNFFLPTHNKEFDWRRSWSEPSANIAAFPALNDLPVNYETGKRALKRWQAMIDRKFLGWSWTKACSDDRLYFFAFPELGRKSRQTDNNLHYHLLAQVPYDDEPFKKQASDAWQKICPSGQAHCQRIGETNDDHFKSRNYATKRITADDGNDHFIVSSEFQT